MDVQNHYDVLIIGAGPGGASAAYFLAKAGVRVALLDKATFPRDKTCGDGLPPRALPVLEKMGVLDDVQSQGWKSTGIAVTSAAGSHTRVPIPSLPHAPSHAVVIPRLKLDHLLVKAATAAGAILLEGTHVQQIEMASNGVVAGKLRAQVAIIATGASTRLLSTMGIFSGEPSIVAARAYFEGIKVDDHLHFRFGGVTMPGYGWVFPTASDAANIGTGFIRGGDRRHQNISPRTAFDRFMNDPAMRELVSNARQVGPVKGYPLRTDFATAPTYSERVLLVGEAAGLVNPLTGDGIDYALESGKIAAEHLIKLFENGDFSRAAMQPYDARLRAKYQRLFVLCGQIRRLCVRNPALNLLVPLANRRPQLAELLVSVVLGGTEIPARLPVGKIARKLLG
jgi:geranylgeranyl reductase family protein